MTSCAKSLRTYVLWSTNTSQNLGPQSPGNGSEGWQDMQRAIAVIQEFPRRDYISLIHSINTESGYTQYLISEVQEKCNVTLHQLDNARPERRRGALYEISGFIENVSHVSSTFSRLSFDRIMIEISRHLHLLRGSRFANLWKLRLDLTAKTSRFA